MKIERFNEDYDHNDGFDYPYGGHTFVLARYKKGWDNFRGSFFSGFENDEFVPCKVSGNPNSKWDKRSFYIIGYNESYDIDGFEIIPNSNKEIEKIVNLYKNSKKYNV